MQTTDTPRFIVVDTVAPVGSTCPELGKFSTMEQVDAFIVTLPDYLSGRYAVDDLASADALEGN